MENRTVLTAKNGIEIKYEFRHDRILLVFCSFSDNRLTEFADMLEEGCQQIEVVEKVIRYDEQSSAMIITMKVGYNEVLANQEIKEVFEYYFMQHLHV